jgi:spore coat polysaccharide biosynthesis protein SpsF
MKIVAIIQARMGSTRLPGKVLKPLLGESMLYWGVHRTRKARHIDDVIIATTAQPQDTQLATLCNAKGWNVYRGSEDDVLDRYYQAAKQFKASMIVRITSDCPLIDASVIDHLIASYQSAVPPVDYASNTMARTYPRGLDVEIFSFDALEKAWREDQSSWREHVTPYIYNHPERFRLLNITNPVDYSHHRWTVDTPDDFELITRIYEHFGHGDFHWGEVIDLLEANPEWVKINQHVEQKKV